ncbi:MAG: NYN domain-containing protein [Phycisphaerales bacterium]
MSIPLSSEDCSSARYPKRRVIGYIDGFNVYYGLKNASRDADTLARKHGGPLEELLGRSLYWIDLQAVFLSQLKPSEHCVAIKYFSAPRRVPRTASEAERPAYIASNERQRTFLEALRTLSLVEVILGWYSENDPLVCACGAVTPRFEEKVTDVNIATHMLCDAYEKRLDVAVVMSADADLVPAVKAVRRAGVEVVLLLPPGRKRAQHLREASDHNVRGLKIRAIRGNRLPDRVERGGSLSAIECPVEWTAPGRWVWNSPDPALRRGP